MYSEDILCYVGSVSPLPVPRILYFVSKKALVLLERGENKHPEVLL